MNRPKFTKNINTTLREDMYNQIVKICEEKDISLSDFFRQSLKIKIDEEISNEK
jgi:hypothetical protein